MKIELEIPDEELKEALTCVIAKALYNGYSSENKLNEAIETIQDMLDVAKKTGSAYVYTHNGGDERIINVLDQLQAYKEQLGKLEKELEQLKENKEADRR